MIDMMSVSETLTDKSLLKKEQIEKFSQLPEIKTWLDGSGLKPSTRTYYTKRLFEFLDGEEPKQFLEETAMQRAMGGEVVATNTGTRTCKYCGKGIGTNDPFCANCGKSQA